MLTSNMQKYGFVSALKALDLSRQHKYFHFYIGKYQNSYKIPSFIQTVNRFKNLARQSYIFCFLCMRNYKAIKTCKSRNCAENVKCIFTMLNLGNHKEQKSSFEFIVIRLFDFGFVLCSRSDKSLNAECISFVTIKQRVFDIKSVTNFRKFLKKGVQSSRLS